MRKICSLIIVNIIILTLFTTVSAGAVESRRSLYEDVKGDFWAYDAIEYSTDRHYFSGYEDGNFYPDNTITRAEAAKVLSLYFHLCPKPENQGCFNDVSSYEWYAEYVHASKNIFFDLNNQKYFRPDDPITREETIYILVNEGKLNTKIKYLDMSLIDGFNDSNYINSAMKPHLAIGVQTNLISGYSDGSIKPKQSLSRAEFATLLYRTAKLSK